MTWPWGKKWRLNLHFTNFKCQVENWNAAEAKLWAGVCACPEGMESERKVRRVTIFPPSERLVPSQHYRTPHCATSLWLWVRKKRHIRYKGHENLVTHLLSSFGKLFLKAYCILCFPFEIPWCWSNISFLISWNDFFFRN